MPGSCRRSTPIPSMATSPADLVYVNYGTPEDYEQLAKLGVDVKGKIVIARYGRSWRGIKPKVAAEHGAVGCIIYSDPRDDGFFQGDVFPQGAWRPDRACSAAASWICRSIPATRSRLESAPRAGAQAAGSEARRRRFTKIPVLPISYGDAQPLLEALRGPVAPQAWRGALADHLSRRPGTGESAPEARRSIWSVKPLYNVIARIDGIDLPDEWIMRGNHHDAWVNGASDPTERQRRADGRRPARFGELLKTGWKPRRTIIYCVWDGEEVGPARIDRMGREARDELQSKAVAYINSDSTGKGWLSMGGSHSLESFINGVARDVADPRDSGRSASTPSARG